MRVLQGVCLSDSGRTAFRSRVPTVGTPWLAHVGSLLGDHNFETRRNRNTSTANEEKPASKFGHRCSGGSISMKFKRVGLLVAIVLTVALLFLLFKAWPDLCATRYQADSGDGFLVRFGDHSCAPLVRRGLFLIVSVPSSGRVCTSTTLPSGLVYYRFEYVFQDGRREALRWNDHGKAGVQVWLIGFRDGENLEEVFVGVERRSKRETSVSS